MFHKNKGIRWHILVCAIIVVFASAKIYTNPDNYISYDIDTYLSGDSDFVDSASMVMPSKDMVSESSVAFYEHHDYGDMGNRLYRLSVIYDDEDFLSEKNRLEKQLAEHTGYREQEKDNFYAKTFMEFKGKKAISGGTTANIISRELNIPVTTDVSTASGKLPGLSKMEGVDLVTEGILTLTKTLEYLESGETEQNAAKVLMDFLLDGTWKTITLILTTTFFLSRTLPYRLKNMRLI